jgi:hypothetical protein
MWATTVTSASTPKMAHSSGSRLFVNRDSLHPPETAEPHVGHRDAYDHQEGRHDEGEPDGRGPDHAVLMTTVVRGRREAR